MFPVEMTNFYLQMLITASDFILAAKYLLSSVTLTQKIPFKPIFISLTAYFCITLTTILLYAIYIGIIVENKISQYDTPIKEFDLFCYVVSEKYEPPQWLAKVNLAIMISLATLVIIQTLTIGGIIVSVVLIKRYFDKLGQKFDVLTMVLHCVLFVSNYVFLIAETVSIYSLVLLSNQKRVNIEGLMKNALAINICQSMVQVTNTMSRVLIYFVFWKFAHFCEKQRKFFNAEDPSNDTSQSRSNTAVDTASDDETTSLNQDSDLASKERDSTGLL